MGTRCFRQCRVKCCINTRCHEIPTGADSTLSAFRNTRWKLPRPRRIAFLLFSCAFSFATLLWIFVFIVSVSRHRPRNCPSPAPFPLEDNEEYVCNASGYYDAYHHRPVRWRIFYDQHDPLNGSDIVQLCDKAPATLIGRQRVNLAVRSDADIIADNPQVQHGGHWNPDHCVQRGRHRLAVLVVYRNRTEHLQVFLNHLHPFLQRQQLDYRIFIVEQAGDETFNRAKLFNVGFLEANKIRDYTCFVFHDVDMIPENDKNSYNCPESPTLLSTALEKFKYKAMYAIYFGGVVSFTSQQFRSINGFSNLYWGWGGEDDDLFARVNAKIGDWDRSPVDVGQYTMIKHGSDTGNPKNPERYALLESAAERFDTDGLSSVTYIVRAFESRPLYTWMLVDIGQPA
ncbi:beta-1,4-galactosyltransferase 4-like [Paramacrobiotus metropolitanus]|uniref:beta-1,4-galactosyltransferase 4-like n=1 Tax=Paramacrobiotus metropolitanus TaxID=2943436 RepID=UPI00244565C3|nr:beta-1,4-galactosyltransferase 4-like [Paramacrobiotus metropolitanus]XP_055340467.1 beta-1,4-galactosyltransferase 4-like [Paramacrobiotus metropolitanus]XP_055340468.1 beta-1,4-galactosyltransferase 4-like [Paramacrobiotus metropolitanus]